MFFFLPGKKKCGWLENRWADKWRRADFDFWGEIAGVLQVDPGLGGRQWQLIGRGAGGGEGRARLLLHGVAAAGRRKEGREPQSLVEICVCLCVCARRVFKA